MNLRRCKVATSSSAASRGISGKTLQLGQSKVTAENASIKLSTTPSNDSGMQCD